MVTTKLLDAMHSSPLRESTWQATMAQQPDLHIRCIEFHKYTVGGGLIDCGHIDIGTSLTMSVMLSHAESFSGGRFTSSYKLHATRYKVQVKS